MNAWPAALASVQVVGWALLYFVWQAALIGAAYAVVRRCLQRGEQRYLLGMLTLVALALCPFLTAWRISAQVAAITKTGAAPVAAVLGAASPAAAHTSANWQALATAVIPWLVMAWLCGVALLSLRVWRHWRRLKALVRAAHALPVWQECLRRLAQRFGLRRGVRVLSSALVTTPTLVGWIRPAILLPIAVSSGFPVEQVELILAHELAHLRRFDHLANLFQLVLETLLFYHPVVHWISRDVRNERELCCDALALRITGGSRRAFATALVELEEFREQHAGLTLAASGGVLLERVWQITGPQRDIRKRPPGRFVGFLSALLLVALMAFVVWRQAELRQELAGSAADMQQLLTSQLLPAPIRMPAQTIANLVPQHLLVPSIRVDVRTQAPPAREAESTTPPPPRELALATPELHISDLDPGRIALSLPKAPAPVAATAPQAPALLTPTHIQQPVYPLAALERGIEGRVVVEFGLNADGSVRDPTVVDAQPTGIFDHAATHALLGWTFTSPAPAAADRRYRQTFTFTLHQGADARAGREIPARAGCYAMTGTHICRVRSLDETFASGVLQ